MDIPREIKLIEFAARSNKGVTMIELLVGMSIAAIAVFASTMVLTFIVRENSRLSLEEALLSQKNQIISYLERDDIWTATLNHGDNAGTFSCLLLATTCPPATPGFKIFSGSGNLLFDGQTASAGFTDRLVPCSTFPSATCPLHIHLDWVDVCATCPQPKIEVRFSLEVAPSASQIAKTVQSRFQEMRYLKTLP